MPAKTRTKSRDKHDSYSAKCFAQINKNLDGGRYTVFDIETTGGNVQKNCLTEICAIRYHRGKIEDKYYSLVNPQIPVPPIVRKMTGLNDKMLKHAPLIDQVMPEVISFIGDSILVSHNTIGDMKFIKHFSFSICRKQIKNFYLCTHLLVSKLLPNIADKTLKGVAAYFGVSADGSHRAEGDAHMTVAVFTHLLQELQSNGVKTIIDAIRMQGDIDSGMKIGWAISNKSLQNLPSCPGVVRLFNRERKLIFKNSYGNLAKGIRQLSQYRDLPRFVLRSVLQAYSLKTKPFPNLCAAMLWEQQLSEGEKQMKTTLGYQRSFAAVSFQHRRDGIKISIGEVSADAVKAFGPVEDKGSFWQILMQIADIFRVKSTRKGIYLSSDQALLVDFLFRGELDQKKAELAKKRGGKFADFVKSIFLNQNSQGDMEKLQQIELPSPVFSLLDVCGLLIVPSYSRNMWQLYPIVSSLPVAYLETTMDWREFLQSSGRQTAIYRKLTNLHKQHKDRVAGAHDRGRLNTILWWLFSPAGKSDCTFLHLKDLKSKPNKWASTPDEMDTETPDSTV